MKPLAGDIRMQVSLSDMVKVMWCRPGLRNSSNQSNPSVDSICNRNLWGYICWFLEGSSGSDSRPAQNFLGLDFELGVRLEHALDEQ